MTALAWPRSRKKRSPPKLSSRQMHRLLTAYPTRPHQSEHPPRRKPPDEQLASCAASDWVPPRIAALDATMITGGGPHRPNSWPNRCASPRTPLTAGLPQYLRRHARRTTHSAGDSSTTTTTATTTSREPLSPGRPRPRDPRGTLGMACPTRIPPLTNSRASDPNPLARLLADAALLDLDGYATGRYRASPASEPPSCSRHQAGRQPIPSMLSPPRPSQCRRARLDVTASTLTGESPR